MLAGVREGGVSSKTGVVGRGGRKALDTVSKEWKHILGEGKEG